MALSEERSCAEALMMACDERLGAQSPAALMVCDTFLARDFWTSFVHPSFAAASQVWAWGANEFGQLGLGDTEDRTTPTEVTALHGRCIHTVACGRYHTMAVADDGELWAAGSNPNNQLGPGDTEDWVSFTRVSGLSGRKVAAVACGETHTLALLESGELFAWGDNEEGQLGLGDTAKRTTPESVAALSGRRVAAIACNSSRSAAVMETGELFMWGSNYRGQLGLGDTANRIVPTQVTALAGKRVVIVACGNFHVAAILDNGELFTWGNNEFGQLCQGDHATRTLPTLVEALRNRPVKAVACGLGHTLALLETGELFSWGWSIMGQLGTGDFEILTVAWPHQIHFFDDKKVRSVHCGGNTSAAVLDEPAAGELFVWGDNTSSQLSQGDTHLTTPELVSHLAGKRVASVAIGGIHCIALVSEN